ncbi:MAG: DUF2490 domain-containing protein [Bacteroidota bacterium]
MRLLSNLPVLIVVLLIGSSHFIAAGQTQSRQIDLVDHQLWIDFYPHFRISDKLEYYGDAGYRTMLVYDAWNRIYIRPSVRYHLNRTFELHAGIGVFYMFDNLGYNRLEITPWQGVQINWPQT